MLQRNVTSRSVLSSVYHHCKAFENPDLTITVFANANTEIYHLVSAPISSAVILFGCRITLPVYLSLHTLY